MSGFSPDSCSSAVSLLAVTFWGWLSSMGNVELAVLVGTAVRGMAASNTLAVPFFAESACRTAAGTATLGLLDGDVACPVLVSPLAARPPERPSLPYTEHHIMISSLAPASITCAVSSWSGSHKLPNHHNHNKLTGAHLEIRK